MRCSDLDRWLAASPEEISPEARAAWERHLSGCGACRTQWQVHHALRSTFHAAPVPEPGPDFGRALVARLAREASSVPSQARSKPNWGLRLYWLAVALLSVFIVAQIDWSAAFDATPWLPALLLSPLMALPFLLLVDLEGLVRAAFRQGSGDRAAVAAIRLQDLD